MKISFKEAESPWNAARPQVNRRGPAHVLGLGGSPTGSSSAVGSTFWKRVMRCPFEHAMHELVQLRSKWDDEALTVGFLAHHAREHYYLAHQAAQRGLTEDELRTDAIWRGQVEAERASWASIEAIRTEPGYTDAPLGSKFPSTWDQLESLWGAFLDSYRHAERVAVVATEETVRFTDPRSGIDYSARLDTLVRDFDRTPIGGLYLSEFKSAKSITKDLVEGYQLDLQILGQVWLVRRCVDIEALGFGPLRGVVIDIITKQQTPRVERVFVQPSEQHLQAFELAMGDWVAVLDFHASRNFPRAFGKCIGPDRGYRRCSYFDLCHLEPLKTIKQWSAEVQTLGAPEGFVSIKGEDSRLTLVEDGEG